MKTTVSIAGASGYTGLELLRLLKNHPLVEVKTMYGHQSAGKNISEVYPALEGFYDMTLAAFDTLPNDDSDVLFLALPHGKSMDVVNGALAHYKGRIIDLSADFRLNTEADYEQYYASEHTCPERLTQFTYGLTEFYRSAIRTSDYIANPGCFATAIQLAVLPPVIEGLISKVNVTAMTGSSGSGAKAKPTTHFSTRFGNVKAYKVFRHQHLGEVRQSLNDLGSITPDIFFTPVSGPFVRGIWGTVSFKLDKFVDISEVYQSHYYNAPFVRLRDSLPELKHVVGSNFADIGWVQDRDEVVVGIAIDNMVKGAAGQAIQNMNVMLDFPETEGLLNTPFLL